MANTVLAVERMRCAVRGLLRRGEFSVEDRLVLEQIDAEASRLGPDDTISDTVEGLEWFQKKLGTLEDRIASVLAKRHPS